MYNPVNISNMLGPKQSQTSLSWLCWTCGGINKRVLLINQTATRRLFRWRRGTQEHRNWSFWSFCPSLDLLIREETGLSNPLLHCCGNVPLAAKMKCVVLIWKLAVEVMKAASKPSCMIWNPFWQLDKTNTFLMFGALILVFFLLFSPNHGEWDTKNIQMTMKKGCSVVVLTVIVITFCLIKWLFYVPF